MFDGASNDVGHSAVHVYRIRSAGSQIFAVDRPHIKHNQCHPEDRPDPTHPTGSVPAAPSNPIIDHVVQGRLGSFNNVLRCAQQTDAEYADDNTLTMFYRAVYWQALSTTTTRTQDTGSLLSSANSVLVLQF